MRFDDKYKEVRCDFYDDINRYWCVDAWRTCDDDESGRVVAVINDAGGVFYADPDAKLCTRVVECIKEKLVEMEDEAVKVQTKPETITITLSESQHPAAFNAKLKDLTDTGLEKDEARRVIYGGIEMEVLHSPEFGTFLVESESLESTCYGIVDPYTGNRIIILGD